MDVSQLQVLNEGFGPQDTIDHKFDTLIDTTQHFFVEPNEEIKNSVRDSLIDEYNSLIFELEAKLTSLKSRLQYVVKK